MLWRRLCLARARLAAGFLTCSMFAVPAMAESPGAPPSDEVVTETVRVLDARQAGDLAIDARGHGQDRVRIVLQNRSAKRLNVVMPPGLVASNAAGQGGRGGGGGFQSMGLGTPTNRAGTFGDFRTASPSDAGFQSVPVSPTEANGRTVTIPAGKSVELNIPAVCLNFGAPTPNSRNRFELVDVADYSPDPRVRKALRSLATLGTSQGVAQAVMWQVCNGVSFDEMGVQAGKVMNPREVSLAARFVEALDASGDAEVMDTAYVAGSRLFVDVVGDGNLKADAARLASAIDGTYVLGLPVRSVDGHAADAPTAPALLVKVVFTGNDGGRTKGHIVVSQATRNEGWVPLGKTSFSEGSNLSVLDGAGLAKAVDRALAAEFVNVKVAHKGATSTTLRVENRLPFTLANVSIRAGNSSGAPTVAFKGVGVAPGRSTTVPIQAATGSIDRVELNGL